MTASLVDQALEAAGGLAAWRQADTWHATLSTGGLAFHTRGRPDLDQLHAIVATRGQRVTLDGFPHPDYRAIWDTGLTRIEQPDGRLLEQRPVTDWGRRWGDLDMAAFVGLALWTYASLPFVLAETGMKVEPLPQRRLRVRFPDWMHTHCPLQVLHLDDEGLIRRHDYTALPFGRWARAAHHVSRYERTGSIRVATQRRVVPRIGPIAAPGPTLVWIQISDAALC